jgi:hypothetical protein
MWINGQVVDGLGRPLPDVKIEALSRQRTTERRIATSNAGGQYVICDLRPGTYTLTFALPGFLTEQRTSPLANYVATINAELQSVES